MEKFKYYKELIGAIILAGLMILVALRISDIASGIDALITAFVPLIVGACIAFGRVSNRGGGIRFVVR